jgi:membrane associated rhomboid family serine protease
VLLLPWTVDVPMQRWPWANWALIAAISTISLAAAGGLHALPMTGPHTDWMLSLHAPRAHQLLTSVFLHADPLHLLGNMVFLFCFGNAVKAKLGHAAYLGLFAACGVLASALTVAVGSSIPYCLGASGAIMGLAGAFLILYPRNEVLCLFLVLVFPFQLRIAARWLLALYLLLDVIGLVVWRGEAPIAYAAHVGGAAAGAALVAAGVVQGWLAPGPGEENLLQVLRLHERPQPRRRAGRRWTARRV